MVAWDELSLGTNGRLGRIVVWDELSFGTNCRATFLINRASTNFMLNQESIKRTSEVSGQSSSLDSELKQFKEQAEKLQKENAKISQELNEVKKVADGALRECDKKTREVQDLEQ